MNIVFDLDGTLIDSRMRLYRLFQQLVPESQLSYSQYWERKRNKISHQQILASDFGFDAGAIERFVREWMGLIEAPQFLALDAAIPNIRETLFLLGKHAQLHVCTARQDRGAALQQLESLDLAPCFQQILVTEQQHSKESLIKQHVPELSAQDWMLGDTGRDVQVGKALEMNTCAVLSGFLNRTILSSYVPDLILDSAAEFLPKYIQEN